MKTPLSVRSGRGVLLSEIQSIRIIRNGFCLKRFDEHPSWENDRLPGEFTAIAVRQD